MPSALLIFADTVKSKLPESQSGHFPQVTYCVWYFRNVIVLKIKRRHLDTVSNLCGHEKMKIIFLYDFMPQIRKLL